MVFTVGRGWQAVPLCGCDSALFRSPALRRHGQSAKPEFTPPLRRRERWQLDICLSIISAIRRSDKAPTSASPARCYPPPSPRGSALGKEVTTGDHLVFTGEHRRVIGPTALASTGGTSADWRSCVEHRPSPAADSAASTDLYLVTVMVRISNLTGLRQRMAIHRGSVNLPARPRTS